MILEEKVKQLEARIVALENALFSQAIPQVDPGELTEHAWKGKKLGHRHWADGSLSWGWDFKDQFSDDVIQVLEKGPWTIGEHVFTLSDKVVLTRKVE